MVEFGEIYERIRQGLATGDNNLVEEGTAELVSLPQFEQVLAIDLAAVLTCLTEVIEVLFPSLAESTGVISNKNGEMFEDITNNEDIGVYVSNLPLSITDAQLLVIYHNIQQVHERFFSGFPNLMPIVQDQFISYLKVGAMLIPELYKTFFPRILDYFEAQHGQRLEKIRDFLEYGRIIFPHEAIHEILEKFFNLSTTIIPQKVLFVSYLGDFLLQFLDRYPADSESEISRFIALLNHPEFYFRSFTSNILKILAQSQTTIITPHFLDLFRSLLGLDSKLLPSLMLTIRDLLVVDGTSIFVRVADSSDLTNNFLASTLQLMTGNEFELRDFSCEIFFDFLEYLNIGQQKLILLHVLQAWQTFLNIPSYFLMLLQYFIKKTKLIAIRPLSPDEMENASSLHDIIAAIESALGKNS